MKSVAIIGAGPGGLVAAKTFLASKTTQYTVKVFDKNSAVGGLWAVDKDRPHEGMLHPDMPTNISRFNFGFSDLAWSSIGLDRFPSYYPKAWQVAQYLHTYAAKYISPGVISLSVNVTHTSRLQRDDGSTFWRLQWEAVSTDGPGRRQEQDFDYLIVASGFFPAPQSPDFYRHETGSIKTVHSSKLRRLKDVIPSDGNVSGTVLVIGGGMSGADASSVLAHDLSDARHGPERPDRRLDGLRIAQVVPAPFYALPLISPLNQTHPTAPDFVTLDLAFYDLGKRPPGPIEFGVGQLAPEIISVFHNSFNSIIGDQSELNQPGIVYADTSAAPYVALEEPYAEFLRSGAIRLLPGRVVDAGSAGKSPDHVTVKFEHNGQQSSIDDVVGIVYATGYIPQNSLTFLPQEVKDILEFDAQHKRMSIVLDQYSTGRSEIPSLGFVGYYEGAFWLAMELQAKLLEQRWSSNPPPPTAAASATTAAYLDKMRDLRRKMTARLSDVPQYWMGDYVGFIESMARDLRLQRNDLDWPARSGPLLTARYADGSGDRAETQKILDDAVADLARVPAGRFAGRACFRALQGTWQIARQLDSFVNFFPSGRLTGTASFHPRTPTDAAYDAEYLYVEQGTFASGAGAEMQASRRYVYRYQEEHDRISAWFVKDDGRTVDNLFHELAFDAASRRSGWVARTDHLCVDDMYKSTYCFRFKGAQLPTFGIMHSVKGPRKDYLADTWYTR